MKIARFEIPHKLRPNGQVMWSEATVQEIIRVSGISLDSRGIPQHPHKIWRLGIDADGTATYEIRQGELE